MLSFNPSNLPDPCLSFPCASNEQCSTFYSGQTNTIDYFCQPISQTSSNYLRTGRTMPIPTNTQSSNPCPQGACLSGSISCTIDTSVPLGYVCACDPDWTGPRCGQRKDHCSSAPCQTVHGVQASLCRPTQQASNALVHEVGRDPHVLR